MINMRAWALFGLLYFWQQLAFGQQQYEFSFRNDVKIVIDSDTVKHPGAGGLNSPVFSKIDLNQDGTEDLFVFDRTHKKIFTFLAKNINQQWQWQYAPEYELLFPNDVAGWVLLRDYDQDGHRDLFTQTSLGIKVYRNTTGTEGKLTFAEAQKYITYNNAINLQVASMPAIVDMDNDGDLDILTFDFSSLSTLEYYKNLQKEENLLATTLKYIQAKTNWGNLKKCEHLCNGFVFNGNCRTTGTLHNDGLTLLALDLDGDGDKDLLLGGDGCPDLVKVNNSGTPTAEIMTGSDLQVNFPATTTRASFNLYPSAYYEDVDFDQQPDLLVAPFAEANTGDNIDFKASAWLYKNTGTASSPAFLFQKNNFLQVDMLDVGENSAPALADVDADGDADLLVGHRQGTIWFFRNVGTRTKPIFKKETSDYLNLASLGFRDVKPQFADINLDGKVDLVLAVTSGTTGIINYILNTAGPNQATNYPVNQIKTLPVSQAMGSVPAFYDLDKDGDQDLIITNATTSATSGILQFYRNTGSAANPTFTLENNAWGKIAAQFTRRNNFPLLIDLNQNQDPELLLGDDTGELRVFSNVRQHLNDSLVAVSDLFLNANTNTYTQSKLGGYISLAAADLDGDQKPEIIAGSRGGGLYFLNQKARGVLGIEDPETPPVSLTIYPNPAVQSWVTIQSPEEIRFSMYSTTGQQVLLNPDFSKTHQVNVSDLAPGMYLVQVATTDARQTSYKLIIPK